jgi:RNA ligase (TIGR02306 family)
MSEHHVRVVKIHAIHPHPNADRLELAQIAGWNCVVRKGEYAAGYKVVYIPIDSVLPEELENKIFPPDSKVKLDRHRVKTIKLRGAISQGLIVSLEDLGLSPNTPLDTDVAIRLGITKYEPPVKSIPRGMTARQMPKKGINPHFRKYTDIENFKYYPQLFQLGERVYVSEKLHGTSARYGWLLEEPNTFWKRIKFHARRLFGQPEAFEFCLGSRNVQLQDRAYDGFYAENVYGRIAEDNLLREKLQPGEMLFGEIVGAGIQKGYTYGCGPTELKFFAYDVMKDGRWLNYDEFARFCGDREIPTVPVLYVGPYAPEHIASLVTGPSTICDAQKVREGVVIKPAVERVSMIGRTVLKWINDEYLLQENTDFH